MTRFMLHSPLPHLQESFWGANRKDKHSPTRARSHRLRQVLSQPLVRVAVSERRKMWAVFFEDAAVKDEAASDSTQAPFESLNCQQRYSLEYSFAARTESW